VTALTTGRKKITPSKAIRYDRTLLSGKIGYHGGTAVVLTAGASAGKFQPATGGAGELFVGKFAEDVNASSTGLNADSQIAVQFPQEKTLSTFVNGATTDAVAAGNLGQIVYALDDQTCTIVPNLCPLGRFWGFDLAGACLVDTDDKFGATLIGPTLTYASNDCVLTALQAVNGAVYDVPTTAAASTVTLSVTGVKDGTELVFVADGTKNGHTVQYRFGTTNITAALTASKIHRVVVTKLGSGWGATSTVAP
jgi:hypothetical protein